MPTTAVPAEPAEVKVNVVPLGVVATVHAPTIEVPATPVAPSIAIVEPTTRLWVLSVVTVTVLPERTALAIGGQSTQSWYGAVAIYGYRRVVPLFCACLPRYESVLRAIVLPSRLTVRFAVNPLEPPVPAPIPNTLLFAAAPCAALIFA